MTQPQERPQLMDSPAEKQVQGEYRRRAAEYEARLSDVESSLQREREAAQQRIRQLTPRVSVATEPAVAPGENACVTRAPG